MPWPPKVFWVGLLMIYGTAVLGWILESTVKIQKIPAAQIWYTAIWGTFLLPTLVSFIYFYFREKAEAKKAVEKKEVS
uniref:Uncharacterized protein n=1 Tax=Archaeoglobus fulgidus TaxID=2234 RepID=A0A7J2TJV8_ARCFL